MHPLSVQPGSMVVPLHGGSGMGAGAASAPASASATGVVPPSAGIAPLGALLLQA
jgi:hypothetical protein